MENEIPSMIYYPRGLHQQKAYSDMKLTDDLYPNTIIASKTALSLPIHPYISEEAVDLISKVILDNV